MNLMSPAWPPLTDFEGTSGRLATKEDTHANRAAFLLQDEGGNRIGEPFDMPLPQFAYYVDHESGTRERCVLFQAEVADGKVYFGGWLIDQDNQVVGFASDFELLGTSPPV
jgi:hypothetical protein